MSDRWAVALAVAAAVGAIVARPVPAVVTGVCVAAGLASRRPALLCLGVALLTSMLAARSWAGLEGCPTQEVRARATLVGDPAERYGAVRAEVRLGRRRVEAWARGPAAGRLGRLLAGERAEIRGRLAPLPPAVADRMAWRHVACRLSVESVGAASPGAPVHRVANVLRRTLLRGAASLSERDRSLFGGFVLGDDRGQPPGVVDDFRAAGLSHLLVVSGQNVAFVLALAAPLVRRGRLGSRLAWGMAVLAVFGVLTRWEPSVLRAVAMSALALVASTLARPASTLRLVALAAAAVLVVDPLLVHSLGFRLSVAACCGIALVTPWVQARLPPGNVSAALAVTLGAQAGVAPLLATVFDGVPVMSIPANLLALPLAGPLMVWGMLAGTVAGAVGEPLAGLLHAPTRLGIGWIAGVARVAADLPLGNLQAGHLALVAAAAVTAVRAPRGRSAAVCAALVAALSPAVLPILVRPSPPLRLDLRSGTVVWRDGDATVVVVDGTSPASLLSDLRSNGVRHADVVVVERRGAAGTAAPVVARLRPRLVLAPAGAALRAHVPTARSTFVVGRLAITARPDGSRLEVTVARTGLGSNGARRSRDGHP